MKNGANRPTPRRRSSRRRFRKCAPSSSFWCIILSDAVQLLPQDEQAKAAAQRTIEESTSKIDRKRAEIEEHEANLKKEEDILEGIRDSLKGAPYICVIPAT